MNVMCKGVCIYFLFREAFRATVQDPSDKVRRVQQVCTKGSRQLRARVKPAPMFTSVWPPHTGADAKSIKFRALQKTTPFC